MDPFDLSEKPVSAVPEPDLRAFHAYWREIRGERPFPRRADLDPLDIPQMLPWLVLVDLEREDGAPHFRYRLVGTGITTFLGIDLTGKRLEDVFKGPTLTVAQRTYEQPLALARPVYSRSVIDVSGRMQPREISRIIAPLSRNGTTIDMFVGAQHFEGDRDADSDRTIFNSQDVVAVFALAD